MRKRSFDSIAAHAADDFTVPQETRPTAMPIYQTSVFTFPDLATAEAFNAGSRLYQYSRNGHPNGEALELAYARLEGSPAALAAGSGMGVIFAVLFALLEPGAHAVVSREIYGVTQALLERELGRWGASFTYVDTGDLAAVAAALRPQTRLVYAETIANPTMHLAPLPELATLCRSRGLKLVVDNTFATPYLCRPLEHGAHLSLSSATKFLGGHSDLMAGVAAGEAALIGAARAVLLRTGAVLDPFAAWLTLRGIKTLHLRMERQSSNAAGLAALLGAHPGVERVHYPAGHSLLPRGAGAMLSFAVRGGLTEANRLIENLEMAAFVPSLGDVTTTVSHPVLTSHKALDREEREALGITENLVRVSVGTEDPEDILADFAQALDRL